MKIKLRILELALALVLMLSITSTALSAETFEGTIKGANGVINNLKCAEDASDPIITLEKDFVLVTDDGQYFFLPNLRRPSKLAGYNKKVRIRGRQKGDSILVLNYEVMKNNHFALVWNHAHEMWEK